MLSFENRGYLVLGFLLLPLLFCALRNWRIAVHEISALKHALLLPTHAKRLIKRLMLPVVLFFVLLALLGPKGNPHYSAEEVKRAQKQEIQAKMRGNLILLVDTSSSMRATDTPSRESRLEVAKNFAETLLEADIQPYLILYALGSDLVKMVPRTLDKVFTRLLIQQLAVNEGGAGTEFLEPFTQLGQELKVIPDPVAIVLFTDGDDTAATSAPTLLQALNLNGRKVPIYTVGVGTQEGALVPDATYQGSPVTSRLNSTLLKDLSRHTGGQSYFLGEKDAATLVEALTHALTHQTLPGQEKALADPAASLLWDLYFQIPLFLAAIGLILYLTWPDTHIKKGALMLALLATDPAWERGATLYNEAAQKVVLGDDEGALNLLDTFSAHSSSYVLEKIYFTQALATLGQKPDTLQLLTALYLLNKAEKAACDLDKEKGYTHCGIPLEIDQLKKYVKDALLKNEPHPFAPLQKAYPTDTPIEVLKNTLALARYNLIVQMFSFHDPALLAQGQQATLQALLPFLPVSDRWREKEFLKKGCETAPWAQIIPLYEKGQQHEARAALYLAKAQLDAAYLEQKKGFKALSEALKLLENPPSQTPQSKEALSETIRLFQDLEISDRPFQWQPPPTKTVEKPW